MAQRTTSLHRKSSIQVKGKRKKKRRRKKSTATAFILFLVILTGIALYVDRQLTRQKFPLEIIDSAPTDEYIFITPPDEKTLQSPGPSPTVSDRTSTKPSGISLEKRSRDLAASIKLQLIKNGITVTGIKEMQYTSRAIPYYIINAQLSKKTRFESVLFKLKKILRFSDVREVNRQGEKTTSEITLKICYAYQKTALLYLNLHRPLLINKNDKHEYLQPITDIDKHNEQIPANNSRRPKIAIVIDDVGTTTPLSEKFFTLHAHITFAIMPDGPQATETARRLPGLGYEVILHQPMEPKNYKERGITVDPIAEYYFMTHDSPSQIQEKLARDLQIVPTAIGFNNHQGSAATADINIMKAAMIAAQSHNLYYLDSLTTPDSVGAQTARAYGIPTVKRDIFLDHTDTEISVESQLELLIQRAEKNGYAVGIGHITKESTYKVLTRYLPIIKARGIELVYASELVH